MLECGDSRILMNGTHLCTVPAWHGGELLEHQHGISGAGKWIRLHPVPYRLIDKRIGFKKYQWIEVSLSEV